MYSTKPLAQKAIEETTNKTKHEEHVTHNTPAPSRGTEKRVADEMAYPYARGH